MTNFGVIEALSKDDLIHEWTYDPATMGLTISDTVGGIRCLYVGHGWNAGPPEVRPVYLHSVKGNDPEGSCGNGMSQWIFNVTTANV